MNEDKNMVRIRVTIDRIKGMAKALDSLCDDLMVRNPKLFAILAESPLEELRRMRDELDQLLEPLKHSSEASATPLSADTISTSAAPGPVESTS
jgi:hypothetical protein